MGGGGGGGGGGREGGREGGGGGGGRRREMETHQGRRAREGRHKINKERRQGEG